MSEAITPVVTAQASRRLESVLLPSELRLAPPVESGKSVCFRLLTCAQLAEGSIKVGANLIAIGSLICTHSHSRKLASAGSRARAKLEPA